MQLNQIWGGEIYKRIRLEETGQDRGVPWTYVEHVKFGFGDLVVAGPAAYGSALVPLGRTTLMPAGGHALISVTQSRRHIRVAAWKGGWGLTTKHILKVME